MKILVHQLSVPLNYDDASIVRCLVRRLRCISDQVVEHEVVRRSLDARSRHAEPRYVLSVSAEVDIQELPAGVESNDIQIVKEPSRSPSITFTGKDRPIVVGAGPAGLLAAHVLAQAGARPILIERGDPVESRGRPVAAFWNKGELDPESNVLFGEGGAGLFSDGKLTTRTKDRRRCRQFLDLLVSCGASPDILVDTEPHLGSDLLLKVVPAIRKGIESQGGEFRFNSKLEKVIVEEGQLTAVEVNGETIPCSQCVLATGHSARDVYEMLAESSVELQPKAFAVGVRLEIPQTAIDHAQYGKFVGHPKLGPAGFRLTRKPEKDIRACYTFCTCPGGKVISCASEPGHVTSNGMSYSRRSLACGNAAFLVPVSESDYPAHNHPALAGIAFQREIEAKVFDAGDKTYSLPKYGLADFMSGTVTGILPEFVTQTLRAVLGPMLYELNRIPLSEVTLYAAETRSSSPVRIARDDSGCSVGTQGLYPAGEGSGYAGGIVSSAIDGIRAAEACCAHG